MSQDELDNKGRKKVALTSNQLTVQESYRGSSEWSLNVDGKTVISKGRKVEE
jgi:hypothetical protein